MTLTTFDTSGDKAENYRAATKDPISIISYFIGSHIASLMFRTFMKMTSDQLCDM